MFDKFAEELKTAREKCGLTIQQVAAKSRIDIKFLESMEIGDFSFLPEIYVKAFVKDYSNIVGLDPVVTLKKFDAARHGKLYSEEEEIKSPEPEIPVGKNAPIPKPAIEQPAIEKPVSTPVPAATSFDGIIEDDKAAKKSSSSSQKNLAIGILVAVILVLAALVYLIFFNKSDEIIINEKPAGEVVQKDNQNKQRYVEETPPMNTANISDSNSNINNSKIIPAVDSLLLNIKATDTSWVRIVIDDTLEEEFILFPQSQKNLRAGMKYKIAFGRAKNISLQLDEKPLKFTPRTEVSYVLIDKKGIQYLTRSEFMGNN